MKLCELTIPFPAHAGEIVGERLENESGISTMGYSIDTERKTPDVSRLRLYFTDRDDAVRHIDRIEELFRSLNLPCAIEQKLLDEDHYLSAYRSFLKPYLLERLIWIVPFARDQFDHHAGRRAVFIDHQYAFGTGTHATTHLALSLLVKFVKRKHTPGRMLDIGCGSGILAVTAALFGYSDITAIDVEEAAIGCTADNARANNVIIPRIMRGSVETVAGEQFSLVLMNIETEIILSLIERTAALVAPGGVLILSGILRERKREVRDALKQLPFSIVRERSRGDWHAMHLKRRPA
ncbi:MAG: 50S ribosomal protein L11 methyltransferase [Spirochaetes bacterium]|nr:50S ribosomal protein L11 methyltransferase [Spirochaetota bacterium]